MSLCVCVYTLISQNLALRQRLWNINNLQPNDEGNVSSESHNSLETMNPNIITSKLINKRIAKLQQETDICVIIALDL